MEQRLARLEDWRQTVEEVLPEIRTDVKKLCSEMAELRVEMARLTASPRCPQPGLCLGLEKEMAKAQMHIRELESVNDRAQGGMKVIITSMTVGGGLVGGLITWAAQHFFKHNP